MVATIANNVTIGGKVFGYQLPWNGQRLSLSPTCPYIAFDTETEIVDLTVQVPRLALVAVSTGKQHVLLHPDQVAEFIQKHADARFVFHNAAFDFWVIDRHLTEVGAEQAKQKWWDACHDNRMHDSMLLDALIRLAEGRAQKIKMSDKDWLPLRDLAEVAAEYTALRISKDDPYRQRYAEIIGKDWADVDQGFFDYAIKDAIVTYRAYLGMMDKAERLMGENGYDPKLMPATPHHIVPDAVKRFGRLTEHIQVKGSVALAQVTRNGMNLDVERVNALSLRYHDELDQIIQTFQEKYPDVIKKDRGGSVYINSKTQTPGVNENVLRQRLLQAVEEAKADIKVPRTPKGKVSTSAKEWTPHADKHPLIKLWVEREKVSKLCEFFGKLRGDVVHPRYNTLLRTGRTSCTSPNVQQMPRVGGFRELFIPSPGHLLLAVDYGYIELRTLAAVCEARYGKSSLADTIRAGTDPHCFTAAMFTGMPMAEFMALKNTPEGMKKFKQARQNAKAVNFGVPGGLGAASLVEYASSTYKVEITLEQATAMRRKLITEVYPELNEKDGYLSDDGMSILARNLNTRVDACWKALDWKGTRDRSVVFCVQKIVRGKAVKKDGTPYKESYVNSVWDALIDLNRNGDPRLTELLEGREGSEELCRLMFNQAVVTLTGRIRGNVAYTQARNTPFQGLAADGAKLALWNLMRAGFRVVGFVHDEILVELPDKGGYVDEADARKVEEIMCRSMEEVTGKVPVACEFTLATRWSKEAKVIIKDGRLYAWSTADR